MTGSVLVIDDHARPRRALAAELEDAGYEVAQAKNGEEGWDAFRRCQPDLVITDLVMPRCDGYDLLRRIRRQSDVPVIVFSAQGSLRAAVSALKAGADDFVSSEDMDVEGLVALARATVADRRGLVSLPLLGGQLVGSSPAICKIRERIAGLAPLNTPVWVGGERGTGRNLVVRALHEFGSTSDGDLLTIDCASWESARGMPRARAIHLRGVEELSPSAQAFWSDRARQLEADGFAAGPRLFGSGFCLPAEESSRSYATPLCGVLKRFPIELPPLAERRDDVPDIADSLVLKIAGEMGREARLTEPARNFLREQRWPRNSEQLEEVLERAVAYSRDPLLRRDLLLEITLELECSLRSIRRRQSMREQEQLLIALREAGGNISLTAQRMGKSRGTVYRLLDKYGISIPRPS